MTGLYPCNPRSRTGGLSLFLHDQRQGNYGFDFFAGLTGCVFFGGAGFLIRSTFQVRITCGWRGLSTTIAPSASRA